MLAGSIAYKDISRIYDYSTTHIDKIDKINKFPLPSCALTCNDDVRQRVTFKYSN